jgi:hypothetical protein
MPGGCLVRKNIRSLLFHPPDETSDVRPESYSEGIPGPIHTPTHSAGRRGAGITHSIELWYNWGRPVTQSGNCFNENHVLFPPHALLRL